MTASVPIPENLWTPSILELTGCDKFDVGIGDGNIYLYTVTQQDLDDAMIIYYGDEETYIFTPCRNARKAIISKQTYSFISDRYSVQAQQMFQALLTEASILGLTNRIIYIQQLLDWAKTVVQENINVDDSIDAATTVAEIKSINIDLTPFEATDPQVTVKAAMEIPD